MIDMDATMNTRNHTEIASLGLHMWAEIVHKQYLSLSFEKAAPFSRTSDPGFSEELLPADDHSGSFLLPGDMSNMVVTATRKRRTGVARPPSASPDTARFVHLSTPERQSTFDWMLLRVFLPESLDQGFCRNGVGIFPVPADAH